MEAEMLVSLPMGKRDLRLREQLQREGESPLAAPASVMAWLAL
jgi:hypothetical protein